MGDVERLCDRVLVVDHGRLVYDGTLPGLGATVGAQRILVVDLMAPSEDLVGVPHTSHVSSEAEGLRQRLAFDAERTTAAEVLQAVTERVEIRDLSIEEPDIEDVVRRIYQTRR
jgi:ABC-2 type transport system ATP-binding protein